MGLQSSPEVLNKGANGTERTEPNRTETDFVPYHLPGETESVSVRLRFTNFKTAFGGINRNRTERKSIYSSIFTTLWQHLF
jgi:hypothetical protein